MWSRLRSKLSEHSRRNTMQINDTESALERDPRTAQAGIYIGG